MFTMAKFRSFLIFFIPFILFFFYFTNQHETNHLSANSSHAAHGYVEIPKGHEAPSVKITVTKDPSNSWLLKVHTEDFTFTPEKAGSNAPSYHEGHAHIYINGEKINRLYGEYYHLGELKPGKNTIKVTLNSNNHGTLFYAGKAIENSTVIKIDNQ
jgi:hypothetical protein